MYSLNVQDHLSHLRALFLVLEKQKLYAKLEKCSFLLQEINFLGFVINKHGIQADPTKIEAITSWPVPNSLTKVRSFLRLASFYRRFIRIFSIFMTPNSECTKKGAFVWTKEAQQAFTHIKTLMCTAPILKLLDFAKPFEVECDASGKGIGVVLTQEGRPVAYFSEKLSGSRLNYCTYDKEFYAIVKALTNWSHYLKLQPFVLHSDHESLRIINGQARLNPRHAKWEEFLQSLTFASRYKVGKTNIVADTFSRKHHLLALLEFKVLCFELFKELYFKEIFAACL